MGGFLSYAEVPYSALAEDGPVSIVAISGSSTLSFIGLAKTPVSIAAICYGYTSAFSSGVMVRNKRIQSLTSTGKRNVLIIQRGSIVSVDRVSANTINVNIKQDGNSRTGHITSPQGVVSYELIESLY